MTDAVRRRIDDCTLALLRRVQMGQALEAKSAATDRPVVRLLAWGFALVVFAAGCWSIRRGFRGPGLDFTSAVWAPGRALLEGANPYRIGVTEQFRPEVSAMPVYGPPHLLWAVAAGALPIAVVGQLWQVIAFLLFIGFCAWAVWVCGLVPAALRVPAVLALFGIVMVARAGQALYELGQPTILYLPILWVLLARYERNDWVTAAALALLIGKPNFAIPMIVFLLVDRRFLLLLRAAAITSVMSLPMLVLLVRTEDSPSSLVASLRENAEFFFGIDFFARIDITTMLNRLLGVHNGLLNLVVALVILVPTALAIRRFRRSGADATTLSLLMALASLLSVTHENYDVWVALLVPLAAALQGRDRRVVAAWTAPAVLLVVLHTPLPLPDPVDYKLFCALLSLALLVGLVGIGVAVGRQGRHLRASPGQLPT